MSFFVAALLHPEIQTIAQKELDAVTRRERLPTFEDRSRLPFVDAICKEILRWRPVVPMGELLPSTPLAYAKYDDPQVYRMQPQRMTSIRVSSSPKVSILNVQLYFDFAVG
jgi:hypothetical protein